MTGLVGIDRPEPLLQKPPVDGASQLRQRVAQVDDLVEPRPEQVVLSALTPLLRPHRIILPRCPRRENHAQRRRAICKLTRPRTAKAGKRRDFAAHWRRPQIRASQQSSQTTTVPQASSETDMAAGPARSKRATTPSDRKRNKPTYIFIYH